MPPVAHFTLKRFGFASIFFLVGCLQLAGQGLQDPVQWSLTLEPNSVKPGDEIIGRFTATIQPGWHLYSLTTPAGGPNPTTVTLSNNAAVSRVRIYQPVPVRKLDPNFQLETETFEQSLPLILQIATKRNAAAGSINLVAQTRYQCCSSTMCLPPRRKTATATLLLNPVAKPTSFTIPTNYKEVAGDATSLTAHSAAPSASPMKPQGDQQGLFGFLIVAFGFGLAAIFTPCVFPMIPITVSFFVNQNSGGRRGGLAQAIVFCLGIIVLFTTLGVLMKAIAGPFGVVLLGSSPWVNGFVALVFIAFGFSLLGAFELTLPSGLLTHLDRASRGGGYAGTLLMGLTFSLTSFACVGPIVGPLLVASISSNGFQPVFGMISFASGLALPFFLLALFPSYLKRLPRSGAWMSRVKVVLGFIVLACALKYLSNVDQVLQTNFLTRERFLAGWIILFALPGLYLLGFLRMEGIKSEERLSALRAVCGALFLIFSVSLVPGLFGSSLGQLDAYVPGATDAGFGLQGANGRPQLTWLKNQYDSAIAQAANKNKLVLVDFTGYACTNCHWMKSNIFTRPDVRAASQNFVLVELYTDGTDADSEKNQRFEQRLFSTVAIPFYAIFDAHGKVLATFPGLTRSPAKFLDFLEAPVGKAAPMNAAPAIS